MTDQPDNDLRLNGAVTDDQSTPPDDASSVDQAIGTEARVMLKSVRVPAEGSLPDDIKVQIRETVKAHIKEHTITYREIAKQIDKGESTISEVLAAKYARADDSPILRLLNSWIDEDERRRQRQRPIGFYSTSVFRAIKGLASFVKGNARIKETAKAHVAQECARIAIGWAPSGAGKTIGARGLASEDSLAILVRVDQRRGTDIGLARLINEAAGWRGSPRGHSMIEFVLDKLKNTGRLIIVDEGHRLKTSGCEFLRDLADVSGVPILILATEEFYARLTRVRTRSGDLNYDQFARRVGFVCDLLRGLDGKGGSKQPFFVFDEVRAIFSADDKVKLTTDAVEYLQAIACCIGLGMLGLAANVFDLAVRSALRKPDKTIDLAELRKAARRVLIPAGSLDHVLIEQIDASLDRNRELRRATA